MKNWKIVYLHGFNSNRNSATGKVLEQHYKERIALLEYDYIHPSIAFKNLDETIVRFLVQNELIMAGSSLGGFWANYFSEQYKLPCVMVNPCMEPAITLRFCLGENFNFITQEKSILTEQDLADWNSFEATNNHGVKKAVFIGEQDELLDHKNTRQLFGQSFIVIDKNESHQISDKTKIVDFMERAILSFGILL